MAFKLNSAPQNWNTPQMQAMGVQASAGAGDGTLPPDAAAAAYQRYLAMGYPPDIAAEYAFPVNKAGMSAKDFVNLGFSPEAAQRAAQAAALSGADLPAGFINDLMGGGAGGSGGGVYHPPAPQTEVDPRTGELILIGPNGDVTRTGQQVGFAGVDPRAEFNEGARRADNTSAADLARTGDAAAQWRALLGENATMDRANFGEKARMDRALMNERGVMDRAQLGENARQADTGFALDEFRTRANLVPQLGQIALQTADAQRQMLSEGRDYLARAYGQANQDSPLGLVSQGDMSNKLMSNLSAIEGMIPESRVTGRQQYRAAPGFVGAGFTDAPAFNAPGAYAGPQLQGFRGLDAPPAMGPITAYGGGGGGGGGGAGTGFTGMSNPARTPDIDPWETATGPNTYRTNMPIPTYHGESRAAGPTGQVTDAGLPYALAADRPAPAPLPGSNTTYSVGGPRPRVPTVFDYMGETGDVAQAGIGFARGLGNWLNPRAPGYAGGTPDGFTREPMFLGNEKGAELFTNPTNAPIGVVDAKTTKQMGFTGPGYDEGTSGAEMDPVAWLQMMQRMGVQDMGGYGGVAGSIFAPGGGGGAGRGLMGLLGKGKAVSAGRNEFPKDMAIFQRASGIAPEARPSYFPPGRRADLPRYESGTYGATRALEDFNSGGGYGALTGFNSMYGGGSAYGLGDAWTSPKGPAFNTLPGGMTTTSATRPMYPGEDYRSYYSQFGGRSAYGHAMDNPDDVEKNNARGFGPGQQDGMGGWLGQSGAGGTGAGAGGPAPMFQQAPMSQEWLQNEALRVAPPRVRSVFEGKAPDPAFIGAGLGPDFRAPTARMLSGLGESDLGALKTLTNVRSTGRTTLEDLMRQAGYMANPSGGGGSRQGRVRGLGL